MSISSIERVSAIGFSVAFWILCFANFASNIERVFQSSDTAWLIKTGQHLLEHGFTRTDPFSWTCSRQPLVIYQWLFSIFAGAVYKIGGLWLIGLTTAIAVALLLLVLLPHLMLKQGVKPVYVFGLTSLILTPAWFWARPQIVSFILIVIFVSLLESFRQNGFKKKHWLLPLLMVLWANCHSFWFIGLAMMLAYFLPACRSLKMAGFTLLCIASVFLNPYGAGLISYNLSFLSEPDFGTIRELQPSLLLDPVSNLQTLTYLCLAWIAIIANRAKVPLQGLILASLGTFSGLLFYRFAPIAILLTWPYMALALSENSYFANFKLKTNFVLAILTLSIIATSVCYINKFPVDKPVWFTYTCNNLKVIEFLRQNPTLTEKMFCGPALGCSQILENLGPVFIDTRFDFYGRDFCNKYSHCLTAQEGWQAYLDKWKIKTVSIEKTSLLNRELAQSPLWRKVYDDGDYLVWRRSKQIHQQGNHPVH